MTSARHPRTANATPKAPELPTEPTCAPILSTTSPKEISPTPVLTQARSVRSLARCSRASVPRFPLRNPLRNSPDVHLPVPGIVDLALEASFGGEILPRSRRFYAADAPREPALTR